jgi:hypothetical protein
MGENGERLLNSGVLAMGENGERLLTMVFQQWGKGERLLNNDGGKMVKGC